MLGQALLNRGAVADLSRAYEVFSTANLANLKRDLVDPLTIGAVRALTLAERYEEVEAYASRPEVISSPALAYAIKAYPALKQGANAEANYFLDAAIASRKECDTLSTTDLLANPHGSGTLVGCIAAVTRVVRCADYELRRWTSPQLRRTSEEGRLDPRNMRSTNILKNTTTQKPSVVCRNS